MYKASHRLFALGLSSAFAFFLDVNLMALPLMLVLAYFIGSFPDIDMKIGIKHRGFMHSIFFFIAMTFACSIGVFYFYYAIQYFVGIPFFDLEAEYFSGIPVPKFFVMISHFDFVTMIDDTFFKMLIFFFASFMSHFILDIITPSGLDIGNRKLSGSIKSENSFFNTFFSAIGLVTFLASIGFMIIKTFTSIDVNWSTWYFIIVGSLVTLVVVVSIARRGKKQEQLRCYKLDNNINVCIPQGKCFQTGIDKDDKICNMGNVEL